MSNLETLTKVRVSTLEYGTLTYDNFTEAKAEFPTLDLRRGCKKFTPGQDDGDAILFEEWIIHDSFAEDE